MTHLNPHKTGLTVAGLFGGLHLVWSILVALGAAQSFVDFSLRMHMISMPLKVLPFDLVSAIGLVLIACVIGYVVGYALAWIVNTVEKKA
jgi:hypothetical protein